MWKWFPKVRMVSLPQRNSSRLHLKDPFSFDRAYLPGKSQPESKISYLGTRSSWPRAECIRTMRTWFLSKSFPHRNESDATINRSRENQSLCCELLLPVADGEYHNQRDARQ